MIVEDGLKKIRYEDLSLTGQALNLQRAVNIINV